jgi:hypothetical protein
MILKQLVYVSRPLGYDPQQLDDILQTARARNAAEHITGTLISRWDLFVQILEGPAQGVDAVFARIRRDHRHVQVTLRHEGEAAGRLFADWTMRDDPMPSWLWTRQDVLAGRHVTDTMEALFGAFRRLAAEAPMRRGPDGASAGALPA